MYNDGYSIMQNSIRLIGLQIGLLKSSTAKMQQAGEGDMNDAVAMGKPKKTTATANPELKQADKPKAMVTSRTANPNANLKPFYSTNNVPSKN